MHTAAKLAIEEDARSVAEILANFSSQDLLNAEKETSTAYNAIVLSKAVVIVQTRIRCSSLKDLARRVGVSRGTISRYAGSTRPISDQLFHHAMRDLAILLDEEGASLRRPL
jgi:hypothetical protein